MNRFATSLCIFFHLIYRDCLLSLRKPVALIYPWMFFILVILLFPFILAPKIQYLTSLMPGFIWIAALLAYLLSIERIFEVDLESGCLESLLIYPFPLFLSALAKITAHWLLTGLPLVLLSPVLGYLVGLSFVEMKILTLSLLLGTPTLSALGTLLSAITLSMGSRGLLLAMLLIPLAVPVLIFGTGSILAESMGFSSSASLAFLAAITITALLATPYATSAALRL